MHAGDRTDKKGLQRKQLSRTISVSPDGRRTPSAKTTRGKRVHYKHKSASCSLLETARVATSIVKGSSYGNMGLKGHATTHIYIYTDIHIHIYIYTHICIRMYTHTYIRMYIYLYLTTYLYTHIQIWATALQPSPSPPQTQALTHTHAQIKTYGYRHR